MIFLLLLGFNMPKISECIIDRCEGDICIVETPEGVVDIQRKREHREGDTVICPLWLIEPT